MRNVASVTLIDNTDIIRQAEESAIQRGLEAVGIQATAHAEEELAKGYSKENTGALSPKGKLAQSLTHTVKGHTVIVGSNLSYAPYVHEGTGQYAPNGGTGDKYWIFVIGLLPNATEETKARDEAHQSNGSASGKRYSLLEAKKIVAIMRSEGYDAHMTNGIRPNRFLRNAIENNIDEYKKIFEDELKKG